MYFSRAIETTNIIIEEVCQTTIFSILVDETQNVSVKEKMGIVLHYVDLGEID